MISIIQTRVSEGFIKFRCFYRTSTEPYRLSLSLPKTRGWSYLFFTVMNWTPWAFHWMDSREWDLWVSGPFFLWWYIGVTAWTGPYGTVFDDKSTAVFFEIFWPSCATSLSVILTYFQPQVIIPCRTMHHSLIQMHSQDLLFVWD